VALVAVVMVLAAALAVVVLAVIENLILHL
jgi:hypothetical protein